MQKHRLDFWDSVNHHAKPPWASLSVFENRTLWPAPVKTLGTILHQVSSVKATSFQVKMRLYDGGKQKESMFIQTEVVGKACHHRKYCPCGDGPQEVTVEEGKGQLPPLCRPKLERTRLGNGHTLTASSSTLPISVPTRHTISPFILNL